ncbi:hypothetical protein [Halobacillus sp. A5]|uniref:hypothetical protein n=1 Tax=Halobacillus sp. A5 TaxID=2880263 RepID=UPI0020A64ABA|nr:hypothetical protein [Halobacillus sp. A5]MCP3028066.1 hypothetical protein [Halobacillus sp. A5]
MKGKVVFTRLAARPNCISSPLPPVLLFKGITCHLNPVVSQFSQLMVKSHHTIISSQGEVAAYFNNQKQKDPMTAVQGDESPLSYLQAAICIQELQKYCIETDQEWHADQIMDNTIFTYLLWSNRKKYNPIFFYDSLNHPVIIFYTYHIGSSFYIIKHIHRFDYEGYCQKIGSKVISSGYDDTIPWERMS